MPQKKFSFGGMRAALRVGPILVLASVLASPANAQRNRIPGVIDSARRATLSGQVHPHARLEFDRGRVDASLVLPYVTLTFSPSAAQQADLQQLLTAQQTPGSPDYHRWLTPDEYAQRFGMSDADLASITAWLHGQGLSIAQVARGRNWVAVSGSAAQMENAFRTSIHKYSVNGEDHFGNSTEPSLPDTLAGVVKSIRGLNDFRAKPAKRSPKQQLPAGTMRPENTSARGNHYLAPNDFATIYNVTPLYNAGITGAGQKIVIAGQTQINLSDIQTFRRNYNLPANDPQVLLVPGSRDPGLSSNDLAEADLDLEWSGAVARNASILYVYAYDVMQAVQYAIDQNLAPVVSTSYGSCELETTASDAASFRSWAQQGNAQGITWFAASGDSGGADCDDPKNPGLSVDIPASVPEVTAVGGTEFVEGGGTYWNAANDANGASVMSPIPETAWNDSALDGTPSASGGGASIVFPKPSWQTGPGVPSDNARHVPDVALNASADHDGYLVYTGGSTEIYGGTSVPAPAFAGIAALLNHYLVSTGAQKSPGVGNINPTLYSLAGSTTGIFRDITSGNNVVTVACSKRNPACTTTPVGYNAGSGYDSVTGLGSVDAFNLVNGWKGGVTTNSRPPAVSLSVLSNISSMTTADSLFVTATVTGTDGTTPTGAVLFSSGTTALGSSALVGSAGTATAALAVSGRQLPLGATTVNASYVPASSSAVNASVNVTVLASGSLTGTHPAVSGTTNAASYQQAYAPGMIAAVFGSQLAPSIEEAGSVPLPTTMAGVAVTINGVSAPLLYVSPTQLNVQIPYEIAPNTTANVSVNNNGQIASGTLLVKPAAPGIFTDQNKLVVPAANAARGQITTFYFTGAGGVGPAIATGAAPSSAVTLNNLPAPGQPVSVTVGGVPATVNFIGIPYGLVGVTQVNFTVPSNVPAGNQAVVITVGGVSSAPAYLTITG